MIAATLYIPADAFASVSTATPTMVLVYGRTTSAAAALAHELRKAADRLDDAAAQVAS